MDISWVAERTDYWDAIGVAAYGLVFALLESVLIWVVVLLLGFLLTKNWIERKRITLLGVLVVLAALWAMFGQLYFLLNWSFPNNLIQFLAGQSHPLRLLYVFYLAVVSFTVMLFAYFAIFSEKFQGVFIALVERLSALMGLYVFLDLTSIIIVLVRNIG